MALDGIRVVELAGLAPSPLCGMILADFGAKVIRVDKTSAGGGPPQPDTMCRGKMSIALNLKSEGGKAVLKKLCADADVLVEPFRRGVMEKLGLGPDVLRKDNPRLIYARITGYGQHGPMADRAGHDINFIAISGLLSMLGRKGENPYPPINFLGDFAGGGVLCALGIVMALLERSRSGKGQIIDANCVEGANYVGSFMWTTRSLPLWGKERGANWLDTGAPWYDTYKTSDGKYMSVGAIEPQFYAALVKGLDLNPDEVPQYDNWPELKVRFTEIFASKTQAEWCDVFDHVDACVAPVIPWNEAHEYKHSVARWSFNKESATGIISPNPAPHLYRTPALAVAKTYLPPGKHTKGILKHLDYNDQDIQQLMESGAVEAAKAKTKSKAKL